MFMRFLRAVTLSGAGVLFFSSPAFAGVNVNNGNFFIAYTDLYVPTSGINIDITRTYNSRSNYVKGFFGVGWASEIEGYLSFDGKDIVYFEGGGGNTVRFAPKGAEWHNGVFGPQVIRKVPQGYSLSSNAGKNLLFDAKGKLMKIADRNRNSIELVYTNNQITTIKDNLNNQIRITWGEFGQSPRITALEIGRLKARYEYSKFGALTAAVGADGVRFVYDYDDEFNMSKITYDKGTSKEITYNKTKDWVTSYKDQEGVLTQYEYLSDSLDPENKFGTIVTRNIPGQEREVSRFWYEFRKRADGSRYNHRSVAWIQGLVTETIFTECCGTPQVISNWAGDPAKTQRLAWTTASKDKRSTFFEYYPDGLLKKKTAANGIVTELTYDKKFGKVATLDRNGRRLKYDYDVRGNLAVAHDSAENRKLKLSYNTAGQLEKILEARFVGNRAVNREVFFRYGAEGRPIEIKEKSGTQEGRIRIEYDANGEVLAIRNAEGRSVASEREIQMASRVAMTFQSLLEVVQPAGVSLTPEG